MLKTILPRRGASVTVRLLADGMLERAAAARTLGQWRAAATLYDEVYRLTGKPGVLVQQAHMNKEAGDVIEAERCYLQAAALKPHDADLALQLGHFYKSTGRLTLAHQSYETAARLSPDWAEPLEELARLGRAGWRHDGERPPEALALPGLVLSQDGEIATEIAPRPPQSLIRDENERIELKRLGRRERTHWGVMPSLRGVESLRGYCLSRAPIVELQISVNGLLIYRDFIKAGHRLKYASPDSDMRKYVFNVWFDFSAFAAGKAEILFRFIDARQHSQSRAEHAVIRPALAEAEAPNSDGVVATDPHDRRTIEDQINARPSMVRAGRRALFDTPPRHILVQRADQLGDVVVSVPAIRRLRALFPTARLVGLVSAVNRDLVETLDMFDEVVVVNFPEDRWVQHRVMPLDDQELLRARLAAYDFDLAIDLSESEWSRYLLLLSGGKVTAGFRCSGMPALTIELEGNTHDRMNGHEIVPHTNKLLGLIEWVGAMARSETNIVRTTTASWAHLAKYGLNEGDAFAVLHDGARFQASRWPYYGDLALRCLTQGELKVVYLTDDPDLAANLPEALVSASGFRLLNGKLPFSDFDSLLSLSSVFVGNDSGPKHVAALRGAKVVSIHMARNNWNEWGQENGGTIISRRVPCNGCLINYEPEDCGKDFVCMTRITVDEVFAAVQALIGRG